MRQRKIKFIGGNFFFLARVGQLQCLFLRCRRMDASLSPKLFSHTAAG